MKYETTGIDTSTSEVTDISPLGIWILHLGKEYFLGYESFPWFKKAPVDSVFHLIRESEEHLRWPDLDVDLTISSIQHPASAPMVYEPTPKFGNSG